VPSRTLTDRVLILDDDEDLREVLAELFTGTLGIDCVGAASMDELLKLRERALSCKLAVLDVNLGPQSPSGFQAYSWLRSQGFAGRIVFLTGHAATRADVQEARRAGEVRVLEKPVPWETLASLFAGGSP
jgi:FixJ family two-component response regulator